MLFTNSPCKQPGSCVSSPWDFCELWSPWPGPLAPDSHSEAISLSFGCSPMVKSCNKQAWGRDFIGRSLPNNVESKHNPYIVILGRPGKLRHWLYPCVYQCSLESKWAIDSDIILYAQLDRRAKKQKKVEYKQCFWSQWTFTSCFLLSRLCFVVGKLQNHIAQFIT